MPIDLDSPLDASSTDPDVLAMLLDLQANILKPHGRSVAVHAFLQFAHVDDNDAYRRTVAYMRYLGSKLTSAAIQHSETRRYNDSGKKTSGAPIVTFALSAEGFRALRIQEHKLPSDAGFRAGLPARQALLLDEPMTTWEAHLRKPHALLMIAAQNLQEAKTTFEDTTKPMPQCVRILDLDVGEVRLEGGVKVEPFGYREGISNPLLVAEPSKWNPQDEWSPFFGLKQVLAPFPGGSALTFGSYLVYRKLEQNVRGFLEMERRLAQALELAPGSEERAGASIVGRFRDGTLVAMRDKPGHGTPKDNRFVYGDLDEHGFKCPFHAHARRTNPRGDVVLRAGCSPWQEREHLIVRRGMHYDDRTKRDIPITQDPPQTGVGTLFMCWQRSVENQYEHVQRYWINANGSSLTQDSLAGHCEREAQRWPSKWGTAETVPVKIERCVHMRGGEYFFAPPRSYLQQLSG